VIFQDFSLFPNLFAAVTIAFSAEIGARKRATEARLIIMDEPTTALTEREIRALLSIIRRRRADGVAVLFVSHKLAEVLEACEDVTGLRNGAMVAEGPTADVDAASLTRHMTGREVKAAPPALPCRPGRPR
jgi:simple sugar transport system ATP-binding protein